MKDYALELAAKAKGNSTKLNVIREYLQAFILRIIQETGSFRNLAFVGGTALRLLHDLPRFSEDLDFSLVKKDKYNFEELLEELKRNLIASGYDVAISFKADRTVQSAFVKFSSLLYEAGISSIKSQNLSIKLDIDCNPPLGGITKIVPLLIHFPIEILSFDAPSLFAGKCHALLCRSYTKGRDFFDLAWYLTNWKMLTPNLKLLKNSLIQTNSPYAKKDLNLWPKFLYDIVEEADWRKVTDDTAAFLEREKDLQVFSQSNIITLLRERLDSV